MDGGGRVAKVHVFGAGDGARGAREMGRAEVHELALTCRPSPLPLDTTHRQ